jgi:hypothetical protein
VSVALDKRSGKWVVRWKWKVGRALATGRATSFASIHLEARRCDVRARGKAIKGARSPV